MKSNKHYLLHQKITDNTASTDSAPLYVTNEEANGGNNTTIAIILTLIALFLAVAVLLGVLYRKGQHQRISFFTKLQQCKG